MPIIRVVPTEDRPVRRGGRWSWTRWARILLLVQRILVPDGEAMTEIRRSYAFVMPWPVDPPGGVNEVVRNLIEEFHAAGEFHPVLIESHWPSVRPVVEHRPTYTYIRMRLRTLENAHAKGLLVFFLSLPFALWSLWHLVDEYRIDTINFHFPSLNVLNWVALQKLRLFPGKVILSF